VIAALLLLGCGLWGPPDCTADDVVLAEADGAALTCGRVAPMVDYAELLSLRALGAGDRRLLSAALANGWKADRAGTEAAITEAEKALGAMPGGVGRDAAVIRPEPARAPHPGRVRASPPGRKGRRAGGPWRRRGVAGPGRR